MNRKIPLYQAIAQTRDALERCRTSGNTEWSNRWRTFLDMLLDELPSGSGWDNGTHLDDARSTTTRLVFSGGYHHMDEGYYDGWTDHDIIVTPAFNGIDIRITGRNRNDIKSYLGELFHDALTAMVNAYPPVDPAPVEA